MPVWLQGILAVTTLVGACVPAPQILVPVPASITWTSASWPFRHPLREVVTDSLRWAAIADSVPPQIAPNRDSTLALDFDREILIVAVGPQVGIADSLTLTYAGVHDGHWRFRATTFYNCNPADMLVTRVVALRWPRTNRPVAIEAKTVRAPQCP